MKCLLNIMNLKYLIFLSKNNKKNLIFNILKNKKSNI